MPPFKKSIGPQTVIYTTIRGKSMVKEMEDVLGTPNDQDVLIWNDALKRFQFGPMTGGGGGDPTRLVLPFRNVNSNATLLVANSFVVATGAGPWTLTLPAANIVPGKSAVLKIKNWTSSDLTIAAAGTDLLEGVAAIALAPEDSATVNSDGTSNWYLT